MSNTHTQGEKEVPIYFHVTLSPIIIFVYIRIYLRCSFFFHSFVVRFGVIPVPEVTGWQPLNADSKFLVVSTDGTFESLTAQDVCDLIHDSGSCSASSSLAECIVNTAFEKGSMDNLSVIVVPL